MRVVVGAAAVVGSLALQFVVCASAVPAEAPGVVVAVVEPHAKGSESGELGFSVSLGESELTNALTILNGLARPGGERLTLESQPLAILIREDVPIGTLGLLVSMATKAGYSVDNITVFLFDAERRSMQPIPGYRSVQFSMAPDVIAGLLGRSAR
ncbi:MAG: hypothetical protein FJ108_07170 [Deltaproteobacteria bacterium]|nr:hypothetical protein [Deltaproteobacteria bacterium]